MGTSNSDTPGGPLSGIRVVSIEHFISGPFCTQMLADQGADVIKIEAPVAERRNGYFHTLNRNKRSVQLDLKLEADQAALLAIVATADVLVTNMGAEVPARLGFDYDVVHALNPQLIYVHITGFGNDSPYKQRPAFDGVLQALSGMMHLTGDPDGPPMLSGLFVPDHLTGVYAALSVSFALHKRALTGVGEFVDLAMFDCMASFLAGGYEEVLNMGLSPNRIGSKVRGSFASTYPASDGYVYLCPLTARMWEGVARVTEQPWMLGYFSTTVLDDTRLLPGNREILDTAISGWTSSRSVAEIVEEFGRAGVAASPILDLVQVTEDPNVAHRRLIRRVPLADGTGDVRVAASPLPVVESTYDQPPPFAGQHTQEVLDEVGFPSLSTTS